MRTKLIASVTLVVIVLAVSCVVLVQQYNAWATADLDRNIDEFAASDTVDACMDEIDDVWLPWLVAEARHMCVDATGGD